MDRRTLTEITNIPFSNSNNHKRLLPDKTPSSTTKRDRKTLNYFSVDNVSSMGTSTLPAETRASTTKGNGETLNYFSMDSVGRTERSAHTAESQASATKENEETLNYFNTKTSSTSSRHSTTYGDNSQSKSGYFDSNDSSESISDDFTSLSNNEFKSNECLLLDESQASATKENEETLNYFNTKTSSRHSTTYGVNSQSKSGYFNSNDSSESISDDFTSLFNNEFKKSNELKSNEFLNQELKCNDSTSVNSPVNLNQADNLLREKLVSITQDDSLLYVGHPISFNANLKNEKRELIKIKVENLISTNYAQGNLIHLERKQKHTWLECSMQNNVLKPKFDWKQNGFKVKLNLITIELLKRISSLIDTNSMCTQREIYYQLKKSVKRQDQISSAMNCISNLLNVEPWYFPINSTSKGLLFGNLTIKYSEDHIITINKNTKETLIPQDIIEIKEFTSSASFIIIVEKDAIFKKLIDEDIASKLTMPFILITGKGYPDINTRLFTKRLWMSLKIPVFILVDGDPYGIDIMLTYRFGSLNSASWNDDLAIPNLRWLGILPSEIHALNISQLVLNDIEKGKLSLMLKRPYVEENPWLKKELEIMLKNNIKAEIEGVIQNHENLTNFYLIGKFYTRDYF